MDVSWFAAPRAAAFARAYEKRLQEQQAEQSQQQ